MGKRSRDIGRLFSGVSGVWKSLVQIQRDSATKMLVFEVTEMENIFVLLIIGGLVGLPSPPTIFSIELLPYLENELKVMIARSDLSQDPIGTLMALLDFD